MSAEEESLDWRSLQGYIEKFEEAVDSHDVECSRELLVEAVKGFDPQCEVADLVQERRSRERDKPDNVIRYPG